MIHRAARAALAFCGLLSLAGLLARPAVAGSSTDGLWSSADPLLVPQAVHEGTPTGKPLHTGARLFKLQDTALNQLLAQAPRAKPESLRLDGPGIVITIPMPDNTFPRFKIKEDPLFEGGLAAKFPTFRTYYGQGVDDPRATVQINIDGVAVFHAQVLAPSGPVVVDPYPADQGLYESYPRAGRTKQPEFRCLVPGSQQAARPAASSSPLRAGGVLRTYRLAVAATSPYTARFGGTVSGALAAIATTVTRVNGIYEQELGIRLRLVAKTDQLIFTNPHADPFVNNDASQLIEQSQRVIDRIIGPANYDIGHTFSTGSGGLAGVGVVCRNGDKARGTTGRSDPLGDSFDVDYVAHEMGHQFGAQHTFNGELQACAPPNRSPGTAYEPGSGSTIEAYAGICGDDDLQSNSSPYFHFASLKEILDYVGSLDGCGVAVSNGHRPPEVTADAVHVVPKGTPFMLSATGRHPDNLPMSFCWEEADLGPAALLGAPDDGQIPLLRSLTPDASASRTVPRMSDLLAGAAQRGESLPQRTRSMRFRVTVRDGLADGGGIGSADTEIKVDGDTGPFRITYPPTASVSGGPATVTWDVAGTDGARIHTGFVNILLSTDGGLSFSSSLAVNARNTGSAAVVLPSVPVAAARIKIESSDNVYFTVSPSFAITRPAQAVSPPAAPAATRPGATP
jgi:hypothetical protein